MYGIPQITDDMKLNAAQALADYVKNPTEDMIIPDPLDKRVVDVIADSLKY